MLEWLNCILFQPKTISCPEKKLKLKTTLLKVTLLDVGETFGEALRKIWNLSRVHPYLVKFHRFRFRFGHSEKGFQISDNNDLVMEKYVANPMPIRNPLSSLSMTTHPHPPIPSIIHILITSLQFQDAHC